MSHWFTVETKFDSKAAIIKAAEKLGYPIQHRAGCRGYNNQVTECELVVKLPGEYDLGFRQNTDGSYKIIADFWSDHISKYLADPSVLLKAEAEARNMPTQEAEAYISAAKISKFTQLYSYSKVDALVKGSGLQLMEKYLDDGSIRLELTGERIVRGVL